MVIEMLLNFSSPSQLELKLQTLMGKQEDAPGRQPIFSCKKDITGKLVMPKIERFHLRQLSIIKKALIISVFWAVLHKQADSLMQSTSSNTLLGNDFIINLEYYV